MFGFFPYRPNFATSPEEQPPNLVPLRAPAQQPQAAAMSPFVSRAQAVASPMEEMTNWESLARATSWDYTAAPIHSFPPPHAVAAAEKDRASPSSAQQPQQQEQQQQQTPLTAAVAAAVEDDGDDDDDLDDEEEDEFVQEDEEEEERKRVAAAKRRKKKSGKRKTKKQSQQDPSKKKRVRGPKGIGPDPVCSSCGTKNTPEWRSGAGGAILCNACGLRFSRKRRKQGF